MDRPAEASQPAERPADALPDDVGSADAPCDASELDGRVHTRAPADPAPPVVRHTHLHDGPKIVHLYDLHGVAGHGGEYRLREA